MKTKVKKYFVTYLSLVLILSNFSFATTLAFCNMNSSNTVCACSNSGDKDNSGLTIKKIPNKCCDTKIVELSNSNILEVLNNYTGNLLIPSDILNTDVNGFADTSVKTGGIYCEFFYHPPNSEIPILNSSLLI